MSRNGTNIYKRKDGRWEARYIKEILPSGKKKYASVYGHSLKEAKEKQQLYSTRLKESFNNTITVSLTALSFEWLDRIKNSIKPLTYQKYNGIIRNHISPYFSDIPARMISGKQLSDFTNKKIETLSVSTVNEILVVIGSVFTFAEDEYSIKKPKITKIKTDRKEMRVLSISEQCRLEHYLYTDMNLYKFAVIFALYTGTRIGELCALSWNDIDESFITVNKTMQRLKNGNGTVIQTSTPKTKSSIRKIPIADCLKPLIFKYRGKGNIIKTPLGGIVEPRLLQLNFAKFLEDCKIEGATFHSLRHTFATRCIESGFDVKSLSEILGHSSVNTTLDKYVHSSIEQKLKNIKLLQSASSF